MKKYILLLLFTLPLLGQVTSRTSIFKLPQWTAGNKLSAGTIADSSQSNDGLNNGFERLDDLLSRQIDGNGWFKSLYGAGTGNIAIAARGSHAYRILAEDSIYGYYNWQTEGNLLVQQNIYAGGYITSDSVIVTGSTGLILRPPSGATKIQFPTGTIAGRYWDISKQASKDSLLFISGAATALILDYDGDVYAPVTFTSPKVAADSVLSDNNYEILYSDTKIAGAGAGDTSANFTTFLNVGQAEETKVRLTYLHRRGNANIKAYYQIKGAATTQVGVTLQIYTVAGVSVTSANGTSTNNATFGSSSATLPVNVLSSNTLYELRFKPFGVDVGDIPEIKNLTIVVTSN